MLLILLNQKKIFLFKGTTDILLQPEIYAAVIAQLKEVRNCLFYFFETIFLLNDPLDDHNLQKGVSPAYRDLVSSPLNLQPFHF